MAGKWDLPGGGRENDESPEQTVIREVYEEFKIQMEPSQIIYRKGYPSDRFIGSTSIFMVGRLRTEQTKGISFGEEGQRYKFVDIYDFLDMEDAIPHLKERLKDYLAAQEH